MFGTALALERTRQRIQEEKRKEQRRKKWVGKVGDIEHIFVNCECCGQPYAREQIIRVPAADIAQWKAASADHSDTYLYEFRRLRNVMLLIAIVGGVIGYYVGLWLQYGGDGLFYAVTAGLLTATFASCFLERPISRGFDASRQKAVQTQKDILTRAGVSVELDKVGIGDDIRKYVLLPSETTET